MPPMRCAGALPAARLRLAVFLLGCLTCRRVAAGSLERCEADADDSPSAGCPAAKGNGLLQMRLDASRAALGAVSPLASSAEATALEELLLQLQDEGRSALLILKHQGRRVRYRLQKYSVMAEGAVLLGFKDGVEFRLNTSSHGHYQTRERRGRWASMTIREDGTISGFFEDGPGHVLRVDPTPTKAQDAEGRKSALHHRHIGRLIDLQQRSARAAGQEAQPPARAQWLGTPWWPGCFAGDASMATMTVGMSSDAAFYTKVNGYQAVVNAFNDVLAQSSFVTERQFHVKLQLGFGIVYDNSTNATYPRWATDCTSDTDNQITYKLGLFSNVMGSPPYSSYGNGYTAATSLFTGCRHGSIAGFSPVGSLCQKGSNSNVVTWGSPNSWWVYSHELGHMMGAGHPNAGRGIMSAFASYDSWYIDGYYQFGPEARSPICDNLNRFIGKCSGMLTLTPTARATTSATSQTFPVLWPAPLTAPPSPTSSACFSNCAWMKPASCSPEVLNCGMTCRRITLGGVLYNYLQCKNSITDGYWNNPLVSYAPFVTLGATGHTWVQVDIGGVRLFNVVLFHVGSYDTGFEGMRVSVADTATSSFRTILDFGGVSGPASSEKYPGFLRLPVPATASRLVRIDMGPRAWPHWNVDYDVQFTEVQVRYDPDSQTALPCVTYGVPNKFASVYQPDMAGQSRTTTSSYLDCRSRCANTSGCAYFNWFSPNTCGLAGPEAVLTVPQSGAYTLAGPALCPGKPKASELAASKTLAARFVRLRSVWPYASGLSYMAVISTDSVNVARDKLVASSTNGGNAAIKSKNTAPVVGEPGNKGGWLNVWFPIDHHTNDDGRLDPNPWWMVDLGDSFALQSVQYYHRSDCCADLIPYQQVELLDEDQKLIFLSRIADGTTSLMVNLTFKPATCFEDNVAYASPSGNPDMPGTQRSAGTIWDCQQRCATTNGCVKFSYMRDDGCHLHDASAVRFNDDWAISGPPLPC